jgi:hypothetical protein
LGGAGEDLSLREVSRDSAVPESPVGSNVDGVESIKPGHTNPYPKQYESLQFGHRLRLNPSAMGARGIVGPNDKVKEMLQHLTETDIEAIIKAAQKKIVLIRRVNWEYRLTTLLNGVFCPIEKVMP